MIQPHISVCLVGTVRYAAVEYPSAILEQYGGLPSSYTKTDQQNVQSQYHQPPPTRTVPVDLAVKVNGMYRLLDVVGESGSNGHGMSRLPTRNY
jgi:hypothetical protein